MLFVAPTRVVLLERMSYLLSMHNNKRKEMKHAVDSFSVFFFFSLVFCCDLCKLFLALIHPCFPTASEVLLATPLLLLSLGCKLFSSFLCLFILNMV